MTDTMTTAGIRDGDNIFSVKTLGWRIFSTDYAFVAVKGNGSVVTWGNHAYEERWGTCVDRDTVQSRLEAVHADGHLQAWRPPATGELPPNICQAADGSLAGS